MSGPGNTIKLADNGNLNPMLRRPTFKCQVLPTNTTSRLQQTKQLETVCTKSFKQAAKSNLQTNTPFAIAYTVAIHIRLQGINEATGNLFIKTI